MDRALSQLSVPLGQLREEVLVSPQVPVNSLYIYKARYASLPSPRTPLMC